MIDAEHIKQHVSMKDVFLKYGFEPNRHGYIRCPFHSGDDTPSCGYYGENAERWHCFGCGAGGNVIDFVMKLFGIDYRRAIARIAYDFDLDLSAVPPRPSNAEIIRRRKESDELEQYRFRHMRAVDSLRRALKIISTEKPTDPLQEPGSQWSLALTAAEYIEYWLNENPWR